MNIFKQELKFNLKSLIIWSLFLIVFILMGMQKYDAMVISGQGEFLEMLYSLPKSLQAIFGLSVLDVTSIVGYYAILYLYLILIVGIHAGMIGASIINKEEKDKTAEFLMVKPVTRKYIIKNKLYAALINVIFLNLVSFTTSLIVIYFIENAIPLNDLFLLHTGMFFSQILFLVVGASFALITKTPKKNGSMVMSVLLSTFFLSMIIDVEERLKILSILTPFKYFDAKKLIIDQRIEIVYILLILLIISICLFFGYKIYKKRDLYL
jgi:ABC-2 type transport system permease protein